MPSWVSTQACDGCGGAPIPACQYICPADLMHIDPTKGKAVNVEIDRCWECFACVKACPQAAIAIRGYSDLMPTGARLTPTRDEDTINWGVEFRDGRRLDFAFPIRSTAWGSIQLFSGLPWPRTAELRGPGLCGEDAPPPAKAAAR